MRDRLIELLRETFNYTRGVCIDFDEAVEINADHLLADGWIRPPCKVGQMVYQTDGTRIYESCITHIEIYSFATVFYTDGVTFDETAIGQSIYLTREQAERALAERSEK